MTTETSNARGEVVAWEARDPDDGTRWVTRHASERDGWMGLGRTIRPLIYAATPPPADARGDVPYDRELIAQMLEAARRGSLHQFSVESVEGAVAALRAADNADAADVGTARVDARGDVRSVIARAIGCGYSRGHRDTMEGTYTDVGYEKRVEYHGELADDLLTGDPDFAVIAALAAEGVQAGEVEQRAREALKCEPGQQEGESASGYALRIATAALSQQPEARGVVDCPTCGAPAVRSEREGVLEIEDVYRYAPAGDAQNSLLGAAFLTVLRDPNVVWRDRPQADEFIKRVAETCAEQNPAFVFKSALTGERNG